MLGSILWLEITHKAFHRSKEAGLRDLNGHLKDFYRAHPNLSSLYPLAYTQLRGKKSNYPVLKAKAAQTRHLAGFALIVANWHMYGRGARPPYAFRAGSRLGPHSAEHRDLLLQLCTAVVAYYRSLSTRPFSQQDCKGAMYSVLQSLHSLHDLWRRDAPEGAQLFLPFNLRPKAHMLQRMIEDQLSTYGSPSSNWRYGDEDFCGAVKSICASLRHPSTLEARVCEKASLFSSIARYELEVAEQR